MLQMVFKVSKPPTNLEKPPTNLPQTSPNPLKVNESAPNLRAFEAYSIIQIVVKIRYIIKLFDKHQFEKLA